VRESREEAFREGVETDAAGGVVEGEVRHEASILDLGRSPTSMRTLYGIRQSPWTERARWALDHHRVEYTYHEHIPLLGEPLLRRAARRGGRSEGPATVPLLVDDGGVKTSSTAIARHAEAVGKGESLFPEGVDVMTWDELSQEMADVGRAWLLRNLARDARLQREAVPAFVPGPLRGVFAPGSALAASFLSRKHGVSSDVDGAVHRILVPALERVRAALEGREYLAGDRFTWADVCIATSLQAVRPHAESGLGPATASAWANEELAEAFSDLLAWRDRLVAAHR
jgi:glutathione S-transferase